MIRKDKLVFLVSLLLAVLTVPYLARPAPAWATTEVSSDVIGAAGGEASSSSFSIHDTFGQGPVGPVAVGTTIRLYDGFWSCLAESPADTMPPDTLVSFSATPLDASVYLEWEILLDADLDGTLIMYKTSGFPTGPLDGTPVENGASGRFPAVSGLTFAHTGLANDTTYYYAAFDYDASGNYSAALTDSATPFDGLAPGPLPSFTAEAGDTSVVLSWTNPADIDFQFTAIRYSTSGYPAGPSDGLPVDGADGEFPGYPAGSDQFVHRGLTNGTTYYYSAFAADEVPNYSVESEASATPGDDVPPGFPPTVVATGQPDGSVRLRFVAPADADVQGVLVRYEIGSVPGAIDQGEPLPNGEGGVFDMGPGEERIFFHTGLVSDTTYYYALWAFDEVPNYSIKVSASVRPHDGIPPDLSLSVFQNPYLTQYMDIYLISSEALADTSVHCTVDAEETEIALADPEENVWTADYELTGSGTISLYAMARDVSLNWSEVSHEFSSTYMLQVAGGAARSPDGRLSVEIPPGALRSDAYVLISREILEDPAVAVAYKVSPPGFDLNGFMELSIRYDESTGPAEHLTVVRLEGDQAVPAVSYVDRENGRILAFVDKLGTYGLVWNPDEVTQAYGSGDFKVLQNVPNPFAGSTAIAFVLPRAGRVTAEVVTIDGRLVARLSDGYAIPGRHSISWDGRDGGGRRVASGVYFYRVEFGSQTVTRKMVNLR
jgi:chitodextrinase